LVRQERKISPATLFIAFGQPNHERSSPPLLTVLLLLITRDQEEGEGVKNERDGTSEVWALQRSFFMPRLSRMDPSSIRCLNLLWVPAFFLLRERLLLSSRRSGSSAPGRTE